LQLSLQKQIKELQKLERIGFPIGWVAPFSANFLPFHTEDEAIDGYWITAALFLKIIGLFATAFAVCLGAPFWFDLLNKLLKLRTMAAKTGADSGGEANATVTPSSNPSAGLKTSAPAETAARIAKPLLGIGEALRDPSTQFQAAKAYWLAEASLLAYATPAEIEATVRNQWRFDRITHFNDAPTNTQGFLAVGGGVAVLAFRGTEPAQLPDWETDARAFLTASQDFPGEIHDGFAKALASVYSTVKTAVDALPGSGALLYITGHSLGAALATLCAYRITAARGYPVQGVCNYGSPRVGNSDFAKNYQTTLGPRTYRLVNNEDLVTRVPPRALGYEHVGEMVYIDDTGRLQRDIGFWYRFLNLVANAAADFKQAAKTTVRDHSMSLYCEHLKRASITTDKL
jgi:triacylglycerol lipase